MTFATLAALLSPDEVARADRFVFEADRRRFVTARGWLRWQVGQMLEQAPETVRFGYRPHGKPYLPDAPDLHFNLAHSGDRALLGLAQGRALGVDIEQMRPLPDLESIITAFFSPQEQMAILAQPPEQRTAAFFATWTCKEAYLKAVGDGLARPLDSFTVAVAPGLPPRLLSVEDHPAEMERWQLEVVAVAAGYKAAVCCRRVLN